MTSALYVQTRKEVRALLPWWLGVMLATVAMSYVAAQTAGLPFFRHEQQAWLVMAYAAGVLVLAALSVGQELTHGTFAALLVQPVDRRRVLWTKRRYHVTLGGLTRREVDEVERRDSPGNRCPLTSCCGHCLFGDPWRSGSDSCRCSPC